MRPAVAVLLLVALAAVAVVLWPVPVLTVRAEGGGLLWATRLGGEPLPFVLEYTHSVERTPVREIYEADARGVRLLRMEFVSQGAGLPSSGYVQEGGRFVLRAVRLLPVLRLRVGALARPRLHLPAATLELLPLAGHGRLIIVAVAHRPRVALLLGVLY